MNPASTYAINVYSFQEQDMDKSTEHWKGKRA